MVFSMCASMGDSSLRGVEFCSITRLNVAISRAETLAGVVGNRANGWYPSPRE